MDKQRNDDWTSKKVHAKTKRKARTNKKSGASQPISNHFWRTVTAETVERERRHTTHWPSPNHAAVWTLARSDESLKQETASVTLRPCSRAARVASAAAQNAPRIYLSATLL